MEYSRCCFLFCSCSYFSVWQCLILKPKCCQIFCLFLFSFCTFVLIFFTYICLMVNVRKINLKMGEKYMKKTIQKII